MYNFFSDLYPHPYLFIISTSEIKAVDMLTHDATCVADRLGFGNYFNGGLGIDIKGKKLFFGDGNGSLS